MSESELLIESSAAGITLLRLNRPAKRNALATPLLTRLAEEIDRAGSDPEVHCVVLTGGDDIFAAGADIGELAASTPDDPPIGPRQLAWERIRAFPKPLIAAVEGWCLGAGCELLMCCDLTVAGEGARFGQPESSLGIIPGAGGTALLTRLVGKSLAMHMVLTGKPIDAATARAFGLIVEVTPDGQALTQALQLAGLIAGRAPKAMAAAKASVKLALELPLGEHLRAERQQFLALLGSADAKEGTAAFQEKRPPVWRGV